MFFVIANGKGNIPYMPSVLDKLDLENGTNETSL